MQSRRVTLAGLALATVAAAVYVACAPSVVVGRDGPGDPTPSHFRESAMRPPSLQKANLLGFDPFVAHNVTRQAVKPAFLHPTPQNDVVDHELGQLHVAMVRVKATKSDIHANRASVIASSTGPSETKNGSYLFTIGPANVKQATVYILFRDLQEGRHKLKFTCSDGSNAHTADDITYLVKKKPLGSLISKNEKGIEQRYVKGCFPQYYTLTKDEQNTYVITGVTDSPIEFCAIGGIPGVAFTDTSDPTLLVWWAVFTGLGINPGIGVDYPLKVVNYDGDQLSPESFVTIE
jgi:hypothetical protein